jgi:cytochrome bd-type quinol oxidase subunit 2
MRLGTNSVKSRKLAAASYLALFAAVEIFEAIWLSFDYPTKQHRWWEYAMLAIAWIQPFMLVVGLYFLIIGRKTKFGLTAILVNIAIVACAVLGAMSSTPGQFSPSTLFEVLGIYGLFLTAAALSAILLRRNARQVS